MKGGNKHAEIRTESIAGGAKGLRYICLVLLRNCEKAGVSGKVGRAEGWKLRSDHIGPVGPDKDLSFERDRG